MRLRMRVFPNLFIHKWSPQGKWWLLIVAARWRTEGRVTEDCPLLLDVTTGTPSYYATLRTLVRTAESWPIAGPRPRPRTNTAQPPASCIDRSVQPSTPLPRKASRMRCHCPLTAPPYWSCRGRYCANPLTVSSALFTPVVTVA